MGITERLIKMLTERLIHWDVPKIAFNQPCVFPTICFLWVNKIFLWLSLIRAFSYDPLNLYLKPLKLRFLYRLSIFWKIVIENKQIFGSIFCGDHKLFYGSTLNQPGLVSPVE